MINFKPGLGNTWKENFHVCKKPATTAFTLLG